MQNPVILNTNCFIKMKILSWNIAGIRAALKRGSLNFLQEGENDIVCFQETKAEREEVKGLEALSEVYPFQVWHSTKGTTQRKGLSGTAIWSKIPPLAEIPIPEFDTEGRLTAVEFPKFNLVTVYTPNSQSPNSKRFQYRVEYWDIMFRDFIVMLESTKPTIICGDFNVAHEPIDVHQPEKKEKCAGFLLEERQNFQRHLDIGFVDTFRQFNQEPKQYTYWNQKIPAFRSRNIGWRIDYFLASHNLLPVIKESAIHPAITGSDHCPIRCTLDFTPPATNSPKPKKPKKSKKP